MQKISRTEGFTLVEMLVVLLVIGILSGALLPGLSASKRRARNIRCVSNLRQLGLGVRTFADDNGGRLPILSLSAPDWTINELRAALGLSGEIWQCPSDDSKQYPAVPSYDWNRRFNGRLLQNCSVGGASSTDAVLYDRLNFHPHRNGVFPDGRASKLQN